MIDWPPTLRLFTTSVATPELSVAVPSTVEPSLKVIVPLGVPPEDVTVAVSVMACPNATDEADELSDVVVEAWVIVWPKALLVLVLKSLAPP